MSLGASASSVSAAKAALRKQVRASLKILDDAELNRQSEAVCERLVRSSLFTASQRIGIFLAMPMGELRTGPILQQAYSSGKQVFCPRVMGDGWMEFFEVKTSEEAAALPLSKWKIPEPPEHFPKVEPWDLDLLLVPAVALDLSRRRCGQGMGFYDRYVQRAKQRPDGSRPLRTIGLGLLQQRQDEVPCESHDELLDAVVFPDCDIFATDCEPADPGRP
ncbi:unnamed protein product [Symbiodinium necroappetens]|uniref:5-formyltetrahydrofolate cyclo-ligase n=1 Tax=Symbiodinium necroappetens TaxID=1628268 RepID=A0A812XS99_9DINO|nr:unnamed protein product [Symbiodinium necroappetens]